VATEWRETVCLPAPAKKGLQPVFVGFG